MRIEEKFYSLLDYVNALLVHLRSWRQDGLRDRMVASMHVVGEVDLISVAATRIHNTLE